MASPIREFVTRPHTFRISMRTLLNQFRFTPDEETHNSIKYHLFFELRRFGVIPHALFSFPDQYVFVGTSINENVDIAKLCQNFHAILSRDLNAVQDVTGQFWRKEQFDYEPLLCKEDYIEELANIRTMAFREGYATNQRNWNGLTIQPNECGHFDATAYKPRFCGASPAKPPTLNEEFQHPPLVFLPDGEPLSIAAEIASEISERAEIKLSEIQATNLPSEPEAQTPHEPQSPCDSSEQDQPTETTPTQPTTLLPAANQTQHAPLIPLCIVLHPPQLSLPSDLVYQQFRENSPIHTQRRARMRAFRQAYRLAFIEWQRATDKSTVNFPIGTYKMRVIHNLPCTALY